MAELAAYFDANGQTYQQGLQLAFEQVYLGENPRPDGVANSLKTLRSDPEADRAAFAKRSLLPARRGLSPAVAIDGVFGQGFFARLSGLAPGLWAGPVASAYGLHLVRILERRAARMPSLEEVRDAVLRDWKAAKAMAIRQLHYDRLRARYVVEIRRADGQPVERR